MNGFPKLLLLVFGIMAIVSFTKDTDRTVKVDNTEGLQPVVLELFTSQGCSSCPPADALLSKMQILYPSQVIALSYHVDYWNYIGWEDPFSTADATELQSRYNQKLKYRGNYTPQVVVNGTSHFVGSNAAQMRTAVQKNLPRKQSTGLSIQDVSREGGGVNFNYAATHPDGLRITALLVLNERVTQVTRGENRKRTLTNSNIVIDQMKLDPMGQGNGSLRIPKFVTEEDAMQIVLLARNQDMDVVGAMTYTLD